MSVGPPSLEEGLAEVPAPLLVVDPALVITHANPAAVATMEPMAAALREALGVSPRTLAGSSLVVLLEDPGQASQLAHLARHQAYTLDGRVGAHELELTFRARHHDGERVGFMVRCEEITTRRRGATAQDMLAKISQPVMQADRDLNIVWVNDATREQLEEIAELLPIRPSQIMGANIDIFHRAPQRVRNMLRDPKNLPHHALVQLGEETLELNVFATVDERGRYLGPAVSWEVITGNLEARRLRESSARILEVVDAASRGDLTQEIPAEGDGTVAQIARAFNALMGDLRGALSEIATVARGLSSSSSDLGQVSKKMEGRSQQTSDQATNVSAAAEQVSQSIETVAASSEEMTSSIQEIAQNASDAAIVGAEAVSIASLTTETMNKLGASSQEIGQVIKVITSIAQQTNLLALNATIEAARAGEAGKGFAVVANEVKELAKETARATEEIGQKVQSIQGDTSEAVEAIGQITDVVAQINDLQTAIASAVEEQTATTNEISRSVAEAAQGSGDISRGVVSVAQAAEDTSRMSSQTWSAADELSKMADDLEELVDRFSF